MEKMKAELAKLSPEDAASAEMQHFCPVTDEMLGTMGAPEKIDVNGQQVWICCDGCKDKLLANSDEYLAKLKKDWCDMSDLVEFAKHVEQQLASANRQPHWSK